MIGFGGALSGVIAGAGLLPTASVGAAPEPVEGDAGRGALLLQPASKPAPTITTV